MLCTESCTFCLSAGHPAARCSNFLFPHAGLTPVVLCTSKQQATKPFAGLAIGPSAHLLKLLSFYVLTFSCLQVSNETHRDDLHLASSSSLVLACMQMKNLTANYCELGTTRPHCQILVWRDGPKPCLFTSTALFWAVLTAGCQEKSDL